ncbi:hypothetical protein GALMADRAFT_849298 [Galerina marginata CBS 339.88]|uniref:Uncharacterized protein n=1 Tax=Galerina marginata (strain CBS 339.88) TaxID=685588 RepID=A0A067TI01_GALM3|nr:hypothetical protein GALMADRAFT_849298 [Galerina marginata CBS 339.88]
MHPQESTHKHLPSLTMEAGNVGFGETAKAHSYRYHPVSPKSSQRRYFAPRSPNCTAAAPGAPRAVTESVRVALPGDAHMMAGRSGAAAIQCLMFVWPNFLVPLLVEYSRSISKGRLLLDVDLRFKFVKNKLAGGSQDAYCVGCCGRRSIARPQLILNSGRQ